MIILSFFKENLILFENVLPGSLGRDQVVLGIWLVCRCRIDKWPVCVFIEHGGVVLVVPS